ncbi:MAG: enoyl-CoA hydratase [Deltaproteobacteria bacterium]|nr:enoyl-CoA hydratase [Deltaproteobacteria bacterium]
MSYGKILFKKEGSIATITFNDPEKLNPMGTQMAENIRSALEECGRDEEVRAIILTGAGRAFSAGGDLREIQKNVPALVFRDGIALVFKVVLAIADLEKPVIAAVNGPAVGVAFNMVLACDIIVASEEASFSEIFVRIGLIPDGGAHFLLPRIVGLAKAKELIYTGKIISAKEAETLGLVNQVVPPDKLTSTVLERANNLANGPTRAIGMAKKILNLSFQSSLAEIIEMETEKQTLLRETEDHKEGIAAFFEKRAPSFKGK